MIHKKLGRAPKDAELQAMIAEAPGPINFTMLLTLYGDRLNGKHLFLSLACSFFHLYKSLRL